jgi:hypothetical protein
MNESYCKIIESQKKDARVPIVLGVTGHRDLRDDDREQLIEKVREIFKDIHEHCPNSPITLLSSLAEGADRLVAKVALDHPVITDPDFKIQVIAPLPMAIEDYEKDFLTMESKAEFRELLNSAERYFSLPPAKGNTPENIGQQGNHRNKQYEKVGAYIARHSQILIALWDGEQTAKVGGTAQVVHFMLKGIPEPYAQPRKHLDPVESGPVYHIVTPRISNSAPKGKSLFRIEHYPETLVHNDAFEVIFDNILKKIDSYNRDVAELASGLQNEINKNKIYVIPEAKVDSLTPSCQSILHSYAVADTLALYFQKKSKRALTGILVLVVLAVFCFQLYLEFFKHPLMLLFYPLTLALAYVWYSKTIGKDYQNKHLDYRAVAEGLRVQLFWNIISLKEDVSEHYLRKQQSELDWIRYAIRSCGIPMGESNGCDDKKSNNENKYVFRLAEEHWVENQRIYFLNATQREKIGLNRREMVSKTFYWGGLGIAILMLTIHGYLLEKEFFHHVLVVAIGTFLAIAAAVQGHSEKMAFAEQQKQYMRMRDLYAYASQHLTEATKSHDFVKARDIIMDLGKEALTENGDWVLLHRARPISVPKG